MEFGILLFALVAHWSSVQGFKIEEEVQKAQQDLLAQLSKRIDESYIKNPSSASWPEFKEWKDEAFGAFTPKSYELILKRVSEPSPENQTPEERTQKLFDEVLALWDSLAETSNLQKRVSLYCF